MPSTVTLRFPDGSTEYWIADDIPEVGDVVHRGSHELIAVARAENTDGTTVITLAPREADVSGHALDREAWNTP